MIIPKKYCSCCGNLLNIQQKWYYVLDKVYCSYYEALIAEKKMYHSKAYQNGYYNNF